MLGSLSACFSQPLESIFFPKPGPVLLWGHMYMILTSTRPALPLILLPLPNRLTSVDAKEKRKSAAANLTNSLLSFSFFFFLTQYHEGLGDPDAATVSVLCGEEQGRQGKERAPEEMLKKPKYHHTPT